MAVDTVIQLYLRKSVQTIKGLFTINGLSIISMRIHVLLNLLIIDIHIICKHWPV